MAKMSSNPSREKKSDGTAETGPRRAGTTGHAAAAGSTAESSINH